MSRFLYKQRKGFSRPSEASQTSNQKKFDKSVFNTKSSSVSKIDKDEKAVTVHYTLFSEKTFKNDKNDYMKGFIFEDKDKKDCCYCDICDEPLYVQYVEDHIQNPKHKANTEPQKKRNKGLEKLNKLIEYIIGEKNNQV